MAVNPYEEEDREKDQFFNHAIMSLKERCDRIQPPIPLYLEPCSREAANYVTTGDIIRSGAKCLWETTPEMAYVKLLLGCSMGLEGEELEKYLHTQINGEFIYCK